MGYGDPPSTTVSHLASPVALAPPTLTGHIMCISKEKDPMKILRAFWTLMLVVPVYLHEVKADQKMGHPMGPAPSFSIILKMKHSHSLKPNSSYSHQEFRSKEQNFDYVTGVRNVHFWQCLAELDQEIHSTNFQNCGDVNNPTSLLSPLLHRC